MIGTRHVVLLALLSCMLVSVSATWPTTLLEHTAITTNQFAPEGRTLTEQLMQSRTQQPQQFLGVNTQQIMFTSQDQAGAVPHDSQGAILENSGRVREPMAHFTPDGNPSPPVHQYKTTHPSLLVVPHHSHHHHKHSHHDHGKEARRRRCASRKCRRKRRCRKHPEKCGGVVPPPVHPPHHSHPHHNGPPQHLHYPIPPPPEFPPATPPMPTCGEQCKPDDSDPTLVKVPHPPLDDQQVAEIGLEGRVLKKIKSKAAKLNGWLDAQKHWLERASEAAATVRREIDMAKDTRSEVAKSLRRLQELQDYWSVKYKADKLKWAYKDKSIALEHIHEEFKAMDEVKAAIKNEMRAQKQEQEILEKSVGSSPTTTIQFTEEELADPLKFLQDVEQEENFGQFDVDVSN